MADLYIQNRLIGAQPVIERAGAERVLFNNVCLINAIPRSVPCILVSPIIPGHLAAAAKLLLPVETSIVVIEEHPLENNDDARYRPNLREYNDFDFCSGLSRIESVAYNKCKCASFPSIHSKFETSSTVFPDSTKFFLIIAAKKA